MNDISQIYEYKSIFLLLMTLIIGGFTAIRFSYANIFSSTYGLKSFFSIRPLEESGSSIRLLSTENVFITSLLSAIIAFCAQVYIYFVLDEPLQLFEITGSIGWTITLNWLVMVVLINFFFLVKYLFIKIFGWLFNFNDNQSGHYEEYQSVGHTFYFLYGVITAIALVTMADLSAMFVDAMVFVLASFLLYRIILLLFRLSAKTDFSIFYIFSYLCTTEIIPLAMTIGFVIK